MAVVDRITEQQANAMLAIMAASVEPPRQGRPRRMALPVKPRANVGRNDPCVCGSGQKSKRCCRARPAGTPVKTP